MLDLLSELPRGVKEITVVLRLNNQFPLHVFGHHFDWSRLETILYALPQLQTANIVLFCERLRRRRYEVDGPEGISDVCEEFVVSMLKSKQREGKSIIRVAREQGSYNQFIHTL